MGFETALSELLRISVLFKNKLVSLITEAQTSVQSDEYKNRAKALSEWIQEVSSTAQKLSENVAELQNMQDINVCMYSISQFYNYSQLYIYI